MREKGVLYLYFVFAVLTTPSCTLSVRAVSVMVASGS